MNLMTRVLLMAAVAWVGLSMPVLATNDTYNKPPAGVVPTTAKLADVVEACDKAEGISAHWNTEIEEGRVNMWGLKGTYRDVYSGHDQKHVVSLGSINWESGSLNGQRWRQNQNGLVIMMNATTRSDENDPSGLKRDVKDKIRLSLLGETSGSSPTFVVQYIGMSGMYTWYFIDKTTYLITRIDAAYPDARETYAFTDFHKVGAFMEAWHVHASDGHPQNDEDWVTTSDRYGVAVSPSDLAIPQSNNNLVQFPAGARTVRLPVKFMDDDIVIRVTINGRGLDFILDSGSSGIAIDSDIANQLGLQRFGESMQTTAGSYIQTNAIIPDLGIGDIHLKNVIVDSLPFNEQEDLNTKVVGLLGYDFIANAALKIDYWNSTVDAMLPYLFVPPAEGWSLPATFDDGVPFIPVQIGNSTGDHFVLDTGATDGVIFSTFSVQHPDDLKDQGRGREISRWLPLVYAEGVGGTISMKALEVKSLSLGGANFQDWVVFQTVGARAFEGEDMDGLIGADFLRFFDVYLNYQQSQIILAPNQLFRKNAGGKMPGE